jgi:hypothetical protein
MAGNEPTKVNGTYHTNIKIVDGSHIPPYPTQAELMKDFKNKPHYKAKEATLTEPAKPADVGDGKYKVDLDSEYNANNDMMWYGPNTRFKVIDVNIQGGSSEGFIEAARAHGTNIKIALLDENGNTTSVVDVVHMTTINNQLIEAFLCQDPVKQILPAGTFMGATPKKIGDNSGPHLHMHSRLPDQTSQMERKDFYEHWIGNKK